MKYALHVLSSDSSSLYVAATAHSSHFCVRSGRGSSSSQENMDEGTIAFDDV